MTKEFLPTFTPMVSGWIPPSLPRHAGYPMPLMSFPRMPALLTLKSSSASIFRMTSVELPSPCSEKVHCLNVVPPAGSVPERVKPGAAAVRSLALSKEQTSPVNAGPDDPLLNPGIPELDPGAAVVGLVELDVDDPLLPQAESATTAASAPAARYRVERGRDDMGLLLDGTGRPVRS